VGQQQTRLQEVARKYARLHVTGKNSSGDIPSDELLEATIGKSTYAHARAGVIRLAITEKGEDTTRAQFATGSISAPQEDTIAETLQQMRLSDPATGLALASWFSLRLEYDSRTREYSLAPFFMRGIAPARRLSVHSKAGPIANGWFPGINARNWKPRSLRANMYIMPITLLGNQLWGVLIFPLNLINTGKIYLLLPTKEEALSCIDISTRAVLPDKLGNVYKNMVSRWMDERRQAEPVAKVVLSKAKDGPAVTAQWGVSFDPDRTFSILYITPGNPHNKNVHEGLQKHYIDIYASSSEQYDDVAWQIETCGREMYAVLADRYNSAMAAVPADESGAVSDIIQSMAEFADLKRILSDSDDCVPSLESFVTDVFDKPPPDSPCVRPTPSASPAYSYDGVSAEDMAPLHACISHMYEWSGSQKVVGSKVFQCVQQEIKKATVEMDTLRAKVKEAEELKDKVVQEHKDNVLLVLGDLFDSTVPMEQIVQSTEFKNQIQMAGQSYAQRVEDATQEATRRIADENRERLASARMLTTAEFRKKDEEISELKARLEDHAVPLQFAQDASTTLSHMQTLRREGIETYSIHGQELPIHQAIQLFKGKGKRTAEDQLDDGERILRARYS